MSSSSSSSSSHSPLPRAFSPSTTQQQLNEQTWHRYLWVPLFFLVPISFYLIFTLNSTIDERTAHVLNTPELAKHLIYPQWSDLKVTLYGLIALILIRVFGCRYVFTPLGAWLLPSLAEKKGKWSAEAREDRVQRFAVCMFKLLYFVSVSVYGYFVLRDAEWLPAALGGNGDVRLCWTNFPYATVSESIKTYYLIELSYHFHSLVFHLFTLHRNDFIEMTLHHTVAALLVFTSYFVNYIRVGTLVLFLHDTADILAYSVKAVVDTKYVKATLTIYAGLLATWGYTRLYVFPSHVIHSALLDVDEAHSPLAYWLCISMLCLLQWLHVYWYILFLIMGYRFIQTGRTVDIQQKAGAQDQAEYQFHADKQQQAHAKLTTAQGNTQNKKSKKAD